MGRHLRPREPRAHWGLVLVLILGLATLLLIEGYASGSLRRSEGDGPVAAPSGPAPAAGAGPVLDLSGARPRSARMPAHTIALTFDDGPDPRWTPKILDLLRAHHAHAMFFLVGSRVTKYPELTARILREGHEIGSHTYTHVDLATTPGWLRSIELAATQQAIVGATGERTRLLRPPYSSEPDALSGQAYDSARDASRAGYAIVLADHDTKDWSGVGAAAIVRAATPSAGRGAVVMLHDGGGNRAATVAAVDDLLRTLPARGYRFTTVSAGVGMARADSPAGPVERVTGLVLLYAQRIADTLVSWLLVALLVAGGLTLLRFGLLLVFARVHVRRRRRLPPFTPPVTVVVPAYNEEAGIEATVRSLVWTDYPGPVEVIVVDDGSTDATAAIAEGLGLPQVVVIRQENAGKAAALETGIRYALAGAYRRIIVMVDGDTVFEPTTLRRLVAPLGDPRVGAVSGNTKVGNAGGILGRWQHLEYVIGFNLDRRMFDVLRCMPTVPGAIGAFRPEALASVGGVSSDTLAEDTDLTMAICRAGWRVVYAERARAWTEAPSSLRQLWRQRYRWCYGTLQAMWKHRRALVSRGPFGRRALPYLWLYQVLLPLLAPAVDVFALYGLLFGNRAQVVGVWLVFVGLQALAGAYALRLDRERLTVLWTLPLQQVVYRQLMYLVTVQSVVTALLGAPLRWHAIRRRGTFARPEHGRESAWPHEQGQSPPARVR